MNMHDEITRGSPYESETFSGTDGKRQPSQNELNTARFQGRHVAEIQAGQARPATFRYNVWELTT